jgi:hypothetical protein
MKEYRTRPFLRKLAEEGVTSRSDGEISINTLVGLEAKLKLTVQRRQRDDSRVWTDEHLEAIKRYWLAVKDESTAVA